MITYFPLTEVKYSPFSFDTRSGYELLNAYGVRCAESPFRCDVLVATRYPFHNRRLSHRLRDLWLTYGLRKPLLVWTIEPRYCPVIQQRVKRPWPQAPVSFSTLYSGDLFFDNYAVYGYAIRKPMLHFVDTADMVCFEQRKTVALMTYQPGDTSFAVNGKDRDLYVFRQELALAGFKRGVCDIFGRNWPKGVSAGESRGDGWQKQKQSLLQGYAFNLCIENTNYDFYCTEKIWQAIQGRCLPIYYGKGNRIYDDFPRESFIDAAEFDCYDDVFEFIQNITPQEYYERMNRCISVYNRYLDTHDWWSDTFAKALKNTADMMYDMVGRVRAEQPHSYDSP